MIVWFVGKLSITPMKVKVASSAICDVGQRFWAGREPLQDKVQRESEQLQLATNRQEEKKSEQDNILRSAKQEDLPAQDEQAQAPRLPMVLWPFCSYWSLDSLCHHSAAFILLTLIIVLAVAQLAKTCLPSSRSIIPCMQGPSNQSSGIAVEVTNSIKPSSKLDSQTVQSQAIQRTARIVSNNVSCFIIFSFWIAWWIPPALNRMECVSLVHWGRTDWQRLLLIVTGTLQPNCITANLQGPCLPRLCCDSLCNVLVHSKENGTLSQGMLGFTTIPSMEDRKLHTDAAFSLHKSADNRLGTKEEDWKLRQEAVRSAAKVQDSSYPWFWACLISDGQASLRVLGSEALWMSCAYLWDCRGFI